MPNIEVKVTGGVIKMPKLDIEKAIFLEGRENFVGNISGQATDLKTDFNGDGLSQNESF